MVLCGIVVIGKDLLPVSRSKRRQINLATTGFIIVLLVVGGFVQRHIMLVWAEKSMPWVVNEILNDHLK